MPNTYKNKIIYNGRTLIDLSNDTVTKPEHVLYGRKFHTAGGWQTTGIAEPPLNDVNFYDFTGTRLYSYTREEAEALTEMPIAPNFYNYDQTGIGGRRKYNLFGGDLYSDGWNYTLQQMRDTASQCGRCDVGGLYKTSQDGSIAPTYIYYTNFTGGYRESSSYVLSLCVNGTVIIDFYDNDDGGATGYELTGTSLTDPVSVLRTNDRNNYFYDGVIRITPTENTQFRFYSTEQRGCLLFSAANYPYYDRDIVFQSTIEAIELGDCIESIGDYNFKNLVNLETITFPSYINRWGVDGAVAIGTFDNCNKLKHVNFPYGVTSTNCFEDCLGLKTVTLPCSVLDSGNFHGSGIEKIYYPYSLESLSSNFSDCVNLKSIVTNSGSYWLNTLSFNNCINLEDVQSGHYFSETQSYTMPDYMFYNCINLPHLSTPGNNTSFGNSSFRNCRAIPEIDLELYDIQTIGNNCFDGCECAVFVSLPYSILNIGSKAFKDCRSLVYIVSHATTPPTIQSDTFENLPPDCTIYVPEGCLSDYTSAPYWSALAGYMQEGLPPELRT